MHVPGVLRLHSPTAAPLPLVLDSPHSGQVYPADLASPLPLLTLRREEDALVDWLWGRAPAHGATLLAAEFPRVVLDPNRAEDDLDPDLLAAPWPAPLAPGEKSRAGRGLVRRLTSAGEPIYDRRLAPAEVAARIERYYRPYHQALADALDGLHAAFDAVWLLDCHSMKSRGLATDPDAGRARPDVILGDRDGTTCEPGFTDAARRAFADLGYDVAVNDVLKGVEIVRRHGRPAEGRHALQVELNRRLYLDEQQMTPREGAERLRADLDRVLAALAAYVSGRLD